MCIRDSPSHAVKEHSAKMPSSTTQPKVERQAIQLVNKSLAQEVASLESDCSAQQKELQKKDDKIKKSGATLQAS